MSDRESVPRWRASTRDDRDAIVALCMRLYVEDPSPLRPDEASIRRTLEAFDAHPIRGRALVLAAGDAIAGYALLASYWSNERGGTMLYVDELYVVPEHRGHGWSTSLFSLLAGDDAPWPERPAALALEVTPANARARALYERLGFTAAKNATLVKMLR